jgi:putative Mg2+ transporter-C (MgtC) family protein
VPSPFSARLSALSNYSSGAMSDPEVVLRMVVAAALGGAVGLERQLADEVAGFRTHLLVALGACLFGLVSVLAPGGDTRIAAQVVTGIGFLGAGAILRSGTNVRGLTTASSLWLVAGVGLATAFGHWLVGCVGAALAILVLRLIKRLEVHVLRRFSSKRAELQLLVPPGTDVEKVIDQVTQTGAVFRGVDVVDEASGKAMTLSLELPHKVNPDAVANAVHGMCTVRGLHWSG